MVFVASSSHSRFASRFINSTALKNFTAFEFGLPKGRSLLKPLGNPRHNAIKFFATAELLELAKDKAWLVKVTNAVNQHWQRNNAAKKSGELRSATRSISAGGIG